MSDRRNWAAALLAASLGIGALPASALAVTPANGGALINFYPVAINTSAGDQYHPHTDGSLVSYTDCNGPDENPCSIHYYDFFTGFDQEVPIGTNSDDQFSAVNNGRIVFERLDLGTFNLAIRIYDIASDKLGEIDPQVAPHNSDPVIVGDTVAYINSDANVHGDLFVAQVGGGITRLTDDARFESDPRVAPAGNLIVFESCDPGPSECDIRQAAFNASAWTVTSVTQTTETERHPYTDGTTVVYDAVRSSQRDICWQPVGGGSEQCLSLPGEQRDASIAGGVVIFESVAVGDSAADLFAYEVSTNRLFRVTSTQGIDETLNDSARLPDGRMRVVWTSGDASERDVYGVTFELPPVGPTYRFGGFVSPVDALPTLNQMKAGAAVPVKFSLGGSFGLSIFAAGYPRSQIVACDSTAPVDGVEQTVTAGASGLIYDSTTGLYTYVWKTDKAWAGTCRQLVLTFSDGSVQRANFKFK